MSAATASAAVGHKYSTSITEAGSFESLVQPWGLALDSTGNLFVADPEGLTLNVFDSLNAFVTHIGQGELGSGFDRDVAVSDATGTVYVSNSEPDELQVFKPIALGEPAKGYESVTPWTGAGTAEGSFGGSCCFTYVAVNNSSDEHAGDVYFLTSGGKLYVVKPGPAGEEGETAQELSVPGAGEADGLAISPITGNVYVASPESNAVDVFNVAGEPQPAITGAETPAKSFTPIDVGIDPSTGAVYVVDGAGKVVDEFNAAGKYVGQITQAKPEEPLISPLSVAVNTAGDVYISDGGTKAVQVYGPDEEEALAPTVTALSATNVTATGATLRAKINPNGLASPFDTTYRFEYGTSLAYGASIPSPDADIGTGTDDLPVTANLSDLSPNTTYHWRVRAHNENGTTTSPDHTFVYPVTGGGLSDGREYEMVTPPQKNGALLGDVPLGPAPDISEDGSRVIFGTVQCFAHAGSCVPVRQTTGTLYASTRTTGDWVTSPLTPSATQFETNSWWIFRADSATALFSAPTPPTGEDDFYARRANGSFLHIGPLSPPSGGPSLDAVLGVHGRAATADLSHIVYQTNPVWPFSENELAESARSLFEYTAPDSTAPALVGVTGGPGSTDLISACATELPSVPGGSSLSTDGLVVYFNAEQCGSGTGTNAGKGVPVKELFARVGDGEPDARTVAISQPKALSSAAADDACTTPVCQENITEEANWREAKFQGASSDGSKVFFTSSQQLTDEASETSSNLYEYENAAAENDSERHLIDVSAGDTSVDGPRVQGAVAISPDGSHVYFVANGVLTGSANSYNQSARDGAENLYAFERGSNHPGGHLAFIAALSASDFNEWVNGVGRPANVTPDGRFLVFTSSGALTPDTTRSDDAKQVFRYDAQSEELVRVSIGEHGFNDNGNAGSGDAGIVPGVQGLARAGEGRSDPTMSHDGAYVFFISSVGLTPHALDSVQIGTDEHGDPQYAQNVYEYHDGQVFLISDGRDTSVAPAELCEPSVSSVCLVGSDATGSNVLFTTADQLTPQDTDTQLDFYDARVCTSSAPCIQPPSSPPPPCLGEVCHGTPPATPSLSAPGSATFNGAGNIASTEVRAVVKPKTLTKAQKLAAALKACRKDKKKRKRLSCERQARKKYGHPKGKKAGHRQRGKA